MQIPFDSPQLDTVLEALASVKRRGIIHDLALHPVTVGQLARKYELSLPAIHKHIRILENAKLIVRKKVGRTNFVGLNQETLAIAQNWIMQYHTNWGNSAATLQNYVARMKS